MSVSLHSKAGQSTTHFAWLKSCDPQMSALLQWRCSAEAGSNALLGWHPWVARGSAPKEKGGCRLPNVQQRRGRGHKHRFYRHEDTKCFTCFTLQPKSAPEKGRWPVQQNFEKYVNTENFRVFTWLRLRAGMVVIGRNAATKHRGRDHGVHPCSCPKWPYFDDFCNSFLFSRHLSHTWRGRLRKVRVCVIILLLRTTLHWLPIPYSWTDFYCVKVTLSLQRYVLQGNIFYTKLTLWFWRYFILLNVSLL